jgi:hypothetical protein
MEPLNPERCTFRPVFTSRGCDNSTMPLVTGVRDNDDSSVDRIDGWSIMIVRFPEVLSRSSRSGVWTFGDHEISAGTDHVIDEIGRSLLDFGVDPANILANDCQAE